MKKVLVLYAHPNPTESHANRLIIENLKGIQGVDVHDLYETYPYFHIDVKKEKERLKQYDLIVFQHPFYWYSMPALLKLWVDEVLKYGTEENLLKGKSFLLSITVGGGTETYTTGGYNQFPIESFFTPYIQMANLCGMKWMTPMVLHRSLRTSDEEIAKHVKDFTKQLTEWCVYA